MRSLCVTVCKLDGRDDAFTALALRIVLCCGAHALSTSYQHFVSGKVAAARRRGHRIKSGCLRKNLVRKCLPGGLQGSMPLEAPGGLISRTVNVGPRRTVATLLSARRSTEQSFVGAVKRAHRTECTVGLKSANSCCPFKRDSSFASAPIFAEPRDTVNHGSVAGA